MAKIAAENILLYVNLGTESAPDWKIIGCSTSDGISITTDAVAIATKCNGGWVDNQPGDMSWSMTNNSYLEKNPGADYATDDELFELQKNKSKDADGELAQWKLESIDEDFEWIRQGRGFISDFSGTADQGDYLQRDLTVTGSGELDNVPTT